MADKGLFLLTTAAGIHYRMVICKFFGVGITRAALFFCAPQKTITYKIQKLLATFKEV